MNAFGESNAEIKARAVKFVAEGKYRKAIEEYQRILETQPEDPETLNLIGDIYRRMGDKPKSIEMFEKAVKLYAHQAYYDNAVAVCKKILRMEPERAELTMTLAELYAQQGLVAQAITLLVDYARTKKDEGDIEGMLEAYRKLISARPKDVGLRMKLADEYIGLGRLGDACTQLQEISVLYREDGKYEEVTHIEKLIREITAPGEEETEDYLEPARRAEESGAIDEAIGYYHKAANQFLRQATYNLAKDMYLKITDLKPQDLKAWQKLVETATILKDTEGIVQAYIGLAGALMEKKATASAVSVYNKILVLDPENEDAKNGLANLEIEKPAEVAVAAPGEEVEKPVFKVAEEVFPEQPIALDELIAEFKRGVEEHIGKEDYATHYDLGVSFKEMGRLEEAIGHFKKAAEGTREKLKAYELLGRCYIEKGDFETAIRCLKEGLSFDGFNDVEYLGLRYSLALAFEATGQVNEALNEYKVIYLKDPEYFDVPQRIRRLDSSARAVHEPQKERKDRRGDRISYI